MLRRRYIIWIGLCAIIAPLLVNLYTQYASLTELQRTSPLARQASWEHRMEALPEGRPPGEALRRVRWMLEEYRVSLWAQQLGTAHPVSDERVRKALAT